MGYSTGVDIWRAARMAREEERCCPGARLGRRCGLVGSFSVQDTSWAGSPVGRAPMLPKPAASLDMASTSVLSYVPHHLRTTTGGYSRPDSAARHTGVKAMGLFGR